MVKKTLFVDGMHCNSCSDKIENALKDKVNSVSASFSSGVVEVNFDSSRISLNRIKNIVKGVGYDIKSEDGNKGEKENKEEKEEGKDVVGLVVMGISLVILLYFVYTYMSNFNLGIPGVGENTSLILLFFVGILTGFHCVSMCGAFVVSYTTKNAIKGYKGYKQHFIYGGSKVVSYAVIGGFFGFIGGVISFSVGLRGAIGIFAGVFMIFYGLSMMGLKFFRRFQFNPKFLTKFTHEASKNAKGPYYTPFITGLLSGLFIACGPLQAMYLYAMGSGSFFNGFTSLMAFGLGTLPVMLIFGTMATKISRDTTDKILKVSAILVIILGLIILNRGLTVVGAPVTYDSIKDQFVPPEAGATIMGDGYQVINMEVNRYGWEPNTFTLKRGVPVKWNIDVKELTGCNNEIFVQDYALDIKLSKGLNVVEFTPDKTGTVRWSCWMGMIPGSFIVTDSGDATAKQIALSIPEASGGCTAGSNCGSPTCGAAAGTGGCGCGG